MNGVCSVVGACKGKNKPLNYSIYNIWNKVYIFILLNSNVISSDLLKLTISD